MSFSQDLRQRAGQAPRRIAFPEAHDPRVLDAAATLAAHDIARPVLLGEAHLVKRALRDRGAEGEIEVIDVASPDDPLARAAALLSEGVVDGVVAGAVSPTALVVRVALKEVRLKPGVRTLSSSFYMEVASFRGVGPEVLTFTDAGVVPEPGPRQLAEIALEAALARRLVVGDEPRVAFLSFSTWGSAGGPTVDRVKDALERFRKAAPEILVDGELQGDAAIIPEVAAQKAPGSQVAGRANVLVFPNLDAANIAYKLVQRLASATALGPILQGLRRPFNDLSRAASASDIVDVGAITALMANEGRAV